MAPERQSDGRRRALIWGGLGVAGLMVLEVGRELVVLNMSAPTYLIGPKFSLVATDEMAIARGMWKRSSGPSGMVQGTVEMLCKRKWQACVVVNNFYNPSGPALATRVDVGVLREFSASSVSFEDAGTTCNVTVVRMDLVQDRVTSTRERRREASAEVCGIYEDRVAVELVDADQFDKRIDIQWTYEHFLPIYHAVIPVLRG